MITIYQWKECKVIENCINKFPNFINLSNLFNVWYLNDATIITFILLDEEKKTIHFSKNEFSLWIYPIKYRKKILRERERVLLQSSLAKKVNPTCTRQQIINSMTFLRGFLHSYALHFRYFNGFLRCSKIEIEEKSYSIDHKLVNNPRFNSTNWYESNKLNIIVINKINAFSNLYGKF